MAGEENSTQEKEGFLPRIFSRERKVEKFTTDRNIISARVLRKVTIP